MRPFNTLLYIKLDNLLYTYKMWLGLDDDVVIEETPTNRKRCMRCRVTKDEIEFFDHEVMRMFAQCNKCRVYKREYKRVTNGFYDRRVKKASLPQPSLLSGLSDSESDSS